jgi:hypothetical protein
MIRVALRDTRFRHCITAFVVVVGSSRVVDCWLLLMVLLLTTRVLDSGCTMAGYGIFLRVVVTLALGCAVHRQITRRG